MFVEELLMWLKVISWEMV